jgi:hypothetical protein
MDYHVLGVHPGDKDLITGQSTARQRKVILFVKT